MCGLPPVPWGIYVEPEGCLVALRGLPNPGVKNGGSHGARSPLGHPSPARPVLSQSHQRSAVPLVLVITLPAPNV
eukprot:5978568-Alexandrium_andersonii.AAC.1